MPRLSVLVNGGAGPGDPARQEAVRKAFEAAGVRVEPIAVAGPALQHAALEAVAAGAEAVAVGGGDGSVGAVAGALAGTGVALAVLPMGTLNHFAKDAGIPLGLDEAARLAVEGRERRVDVAEVNGRVFVNNSSIGIYPHAVGERRRRPWSQGPLSKRIAMVGAAASVLRRLPAHHILLDLDGRPTLRTTSFVFVGNNLYSTQLGALGTRDALDAGRLGVYHAIRPGRAALLALAARALVGRLDGAGDLQVDEAERVDIRMRRRSVRVALDGEVVRMIAPLRYRIRPRDLVLRGP